MYLNCKKINGNNNKKCKKKLNFSVYFVREHNHLKKESQSLKHNFFSDSMSILCFFKKRERKKKNRYLRYALTTINKISNEMLKSQKMKKSFDFFNTHRKHNMYAIEINHKLLLSFH